MTVNIERDPILVFGPNPQTMNWVLDNISPMVATEARDRMRCLTASCASLDEQLRTLVEHESRHRWVEAVVSSLTEEALRGAGSTVLPAQAMCDLLRAITTVLAFATQGRPDKATVRDVANRLSAQIVETCRMGR